MYKPKSTRRDLRHIWTEQKRKKQKKWKESYLLEVLEQTDGQIDFRNARFEQKKKEKRRESFKM